MQLIRHSNSINIIIVMLSILYLLYKLSQQLRLLLLLLVLLLLLLLLWSWYLLFLLMIKVSVRTLMRHFASSAEFSISFFIIVIMSSFFVITAITIVININTGIFLLIILFCIEFVIANSFLLCLEREIIIFFNIICSFVIFVVFILTAKSVITFIDADCKLVFSFIIVVITTLVVIVCIPILIAVVRSLSLLRPHYFSHHCYRFGWRWRRRDRCFKKWLIANTNTTRRESVAYYRWGQRVWWVILGWSHLI